MIGRSLGFFQPIQSRQSERYVHSEQELAAALLDAAGQAFGRTIVLVGKIPVRSTVKLTYRHNGLTLRGAGSNCGIVQASGASVPVLVSVLAPNGLNVPQDILFDNLFIDGTGDAFFSSGLSIEAGVNIWLRNCFISGGTFGLNLFVATGNMVGCRISGDSLLECSDFSVANCMFSSAAFIQSNSARMQIVGNNLADLTTSGSATGIIIANNNFIGDVDTSAGSGAVIVGNYMNGNTITSAGGDTVANNHA